MQVQIDSEYLRNAAALQDSQPFTIVINDKKILVTRSFAGIFSKKINRILKENPTFNEYIVETKLAIPESLTLIDFFFKNGYINCHARKKVCNELYFIGYELENDDFKQHFSNFLQSAISLDNFDIFLEDAFKSRNFEAVKTYIIHNFCNFSIEKLTDILLSLGLEITEKIIASEDLDYNTLDDVINVVLRIIQKNENFGSLLQIVDISQLSDGKKLEFASFIENSSSLIQSFAIKCYNKFLLLNNISMTTGQVDSAINIETLSNLPMELSTITQFLGECATQQDFETIKFAVKSGLNNIRFSHGQNLLIGASIANDFKLAKALVESGADPTVVDSSGTNPLMFFSASMNIEACNFFSKLTDVNAQNHSNMCAIDMCSNNPEIISILKTNGSRDPIV